MRVSPDQVLAYCSKLVQKNQILVKVSRRGGHSQMDPHTRLVATRLIWDSRRDLIRIEPKLSLGPNATSYLGMKGMWVLLQMVLFLR